MEEVRLDSSAYGRVGVAVPHDSCVAVSGICQVLNRCSMHLAIQLVWGRVPQECCAR